MPKASDHVDQLGRVLIDYRFYKTEASRLRTEARRDFWTDCARWIANGLSRLDWRHGAVRRQPLTTAG